MSLHRPDDETPDALADRLRRLPPPPVPRGLEARLLAAVPAAPRRRGWRLRFRAAAVVLLAAAAAALLAVRVPAPTPAVRPAVQPADAAPTFWSCEQALRQSDADPSVVLNRAVPSFEWPVAGPPLRAGRLDEPLQ